MGRDDDLAAWFAEPSDRRALDAMSHVMMNLGDLPRWACTQSPLADSTLTTPVYIACVEAFFTNARLAAEFFHKMPPRDITARTFVTDWEAPPAIARRMDRVWRMASSHIVHLGKDRVPATPDEWQQEDLSYRALTRIAGDAFSALAAFIDAYDRAGGQHTAWLREMYEGTRPRTQRELAAVRRGRAKPPPVTLDWW